MDTATTQARQQLRDKIGGNFESVALVLQGGGALGSYQGGVYEALDEAGVYPDWVAGISIGALNAALIAGNPPERRVQRLREFWQTVSRAQGATPLRDLFPAPLFPLAGLWLDSDYWRGVENLAGASRALLCGQEGFFTPREPPPWLRARGSDGATSFYDTSPLVSTLSGLIDFDLLNHGPTRISVGVVDVATGNMRYFDSHDPLDQPLEARHVMASGALPPAFAAVPIGDNWYWDGGLVSNTPLEQVLDYEPRRDTLVFQVDLWSAKGRLPEDIYDVLQRQKDIQYSSRTRKATTRVAEQQNMRRSIADFLNRLPAELRDDPAVSALQDMACEKIVKVIQLIYQSKIYETHAKDYQFSESAMRQHWQAGLDDTRASLAQTQFFDPPPPAMAVMDHDVHRTAAVPR